MYTGYPWGTEVPIGVNDRSEEQQAALDAELEEYSDLSPEAFLAAVAARLGVVIQED
jgi:uncharacterized protein YdiU (UPF0061 family)